MLGFSDFPSKVFPHFFSRSLDFSDSSSALPDTSAERMGNPRPISRQPNFSASRRGPPGLHTTV